MQLNHIDSQTSFRVLGTALTYYNNYKIWSTRLHSFVLQIIKFYGFLKQKKSFIVKETARHQFINRE